MGGGGAEVLGGRLVAGMVRREGVGRGGGVWVEENEGWSAV